MGIGGLVQSVETARSKRVQWQFESAGPYQFYGDLAQMEEATGLDPVQSRFESEGRYQHLDVAQQVESRPWKPVVAGSSPAVQTNHMPSPAMRQS